MARPAPDRQHWHRTTVEESLSALKSDRTHGLTTSEAEARQRQYGLNEIPSSGGPGYIRQFLGQFADTMVLVLLAAALVAGAMGEIKDALMIGAIIVLNAVVGFVQEVRAGRAIAALKSLAAPTAMVLRDGVYDQLRAAELVPGDIVSLQAGDGIPADLRLIETANLQVDEASLTGESVPVAKDVAVLGEEDPPLGDRLNMAYKGTMAVSGRGRGIVVATGRNTELGRLADTLAEGGTDTPLQRRLARFGRILALTAGVICVVIFLSGYLRGEDPLTVFLTAAAVAVASMPEALPAVITVLLALGARKMAQHNALMRHLPAVETLGSVTYICSDKTGTLTENRMRVAEIWDAEADKTHEEGGPSHLMRAIALCNDATGPREGDPTETALWAAADASGHNRAALEEESPREAEFSFDSERKRMSTIHRAADGYQLLAKGAPEALIPLAADNADRDAILKQAQDMAGRGLRVLAVASRRLATLPEHEREAEQSLDILGLVGLIDPPRPEAKAAVATCRQAGITPVMITGDHPETARTIASDLGILPDDGEVTTGRELAAMDDATFAEHVRRIRVYARVNPEQKIRIIEALQDQGEFVAMTGDGVNDAPALSRADIGVAMGRVGTDVAREAASLILTDDNFASIVHAVREGRRIFDNIRKFIRYTLSSNLGEVLCVFLAPILGLPIPLLPVQILWINLVTDGLPGLALATEEREPDIMNRPPRPPRQSLFAEKMWQNIIISGTFLAGASLGVQWLALSMGSENWQTMVFTTLTLGQLVHALALRSEHRSLWSMGLFGNLFLLATLAGTVALQLAIIYVPALQVIFETNALSAIELTICGVAALLVLPMVELQKWWTRGHYGKTQRPTIEAQA